MSPSAVVGREGARRRSRLVRLALALTVVLPLAFSGVSQVAQADSAPPGLVLWNKLGSQAEVLQSAYGPNLRFYQPGDCNFVGCIGVEYAAIPAYVPGMFGGALTIGPAYYDGGVSRVHNVVLQDAPSYINPERGTVEAWYRQTASGVPYAYGDYRVFDGAFGLNSGIFFGNDDFYNNAHFRFRLGLTFGGASVDTIALSDGLVGVDLDPYNNTWIHLAGVWDRNGIAGSADRVRLYLNGVLVAANTAGGWGATVGPVVDIGGGNATEIAGKFAVDNLKLWNIARTDFSDRFEEGFPAVREVGVDIKPHSDPNKLQAHSQGLVAVAILSEAGFDATQVRTASVSFGPGGATSAQGQRHVQDVNGDGRPDLVLKFRVAETGLGPGDAQACLTGQTAGGDAIHGCDGVQIDK